ncbi:MAG: hypothetical protein JSW07_17735, partial [bacterium]
VQLALVIFTLIVIYIVYWDCASCFPPYFHVHNERFYSFYDFLRQTIMPILRFIFWYIMVPLFWVIRFLQLKERQEQIRTLIATNLLIKGENHV